jgi:predicted ATPase
VITRLIVKNFKRFEHIELDLDSAVVFIGPNNSGKTTALQALALWELGVRKWGEIYLTKSKKRKHGSITINRREILAIPTTSAKQLWRNLCVKYGKITPDGKQEVKNIKIRIIAEGITNLKEWKLGFEFVYANSESIYCRIVHNGDEDCEFPMIVLSEKFGFISPMSGLASYEDKLERGSIQARIGEGQTAQILRNLCFLVYTERPDKWNEMADIINRLFNITLEPPTYHKINGRITLCYREKENRLMDITNAGRGFHQILLLFSYILYHKNTIILIDEPDAHLEHIRQKDIYNRLSHIIKNEDSQLIIATHSEVILNEAKGKDEVVMFWESQPHIVNDKQKLMEWLAEINYAQYCQALQKNWILYLNSPSDLDMLRAFIKVLNHPLDEYMHNLFCYYTFNNTAKTRSHFFGLKQKVYSLKGIALFNNSDFQLNQSTPDLTEIMLERREIENYLLLPEVIDRFIYSEDGDEKNLGIIRKIMKNYIPSIISKKDKYHSRSYKNEILGTIIENIFIDYCSEIGISKPTIRRGHFYRLAYFMEPEETDPEIRKKLDLIYKIAQEAESEKDRISASNP